MYSPRNSSNISSKTTRTTKTAATPVVSSKVASSENSKKKRSSSPLTPQNPQKRVQIGTTEVPSPMAPGYLTRRLIKPWRRSDLLETTETQLPSTQIWVQSHQQMFELQALAKCRGAPDTSQEYFTSPYPQ